MVVVVVVEEGGRGAREGRGLEDAVQHPSKARRVGEVGDGGGRCGGGVGVIVTAARDS